MDLLSGKCVGSIKDADGCTKLGLKLRDSMPLVEVLLSCRVSVLLTMEPRLSFRGWAVGFLA